MRVGAARTIRQGHKSSKWRHTSTPAGAPIDDTTLWRLLESFESECKSKRREERRACERRMATAQASHHARGEDERLCPESGVILASGSSGRLPEFSRTQTGRSPPRATSLLEALGRNMLDSPPRRQNERPPQLHSRYIKRSPER